jgi:hypothetical protein
MSTATAQAFANIAWQNSIELTVKVILGQNTLVDRLFARSFPQYIAGQQLY